MNVVAGLVVGEVVFIVIVGAVDVVVVVIGAVIVVVVIVIGAVVIVIVIIGAIVVGGNGRRCRRWGV